MRTHPLLALFTTTVTLVATGVLGHGWAPSSASTRISTGNVGPGGSGARGGSNGRRTAGDGHRSAGDGRRNARRGRPTGTVRTSASSPGRFLRADTELWSRRVPSPSPTTALEPTLSPAHAGFVGLLTRPGPPIGAYVGARAMNLPAAGAVALGTVLGPPLRTAQPAGYDHHEAGRLVPTLVGTEPTGRITPSAQARGAWLSLRLCESGDDYGADTGNGYYGAYQFTATTWWSIGYAGLPDEAPAAVQDRAARVLQARVGWGAWPACSTVLGLH